MECYKTTTIKKFHDRELSNALHACTVVYSPRKRWNLETRSGIFFISYNSINGHNMVYVAFLRDYSNV